MLENYGNDGWFCCSHLLDEIFMLFSVSLLLVVPLILEPLPCIADVCENIG